MIKEAIGVGKTVDMAIEHACQQIGYPREEVEIVVLNLPRKGFLGLLGYTPAKVKVTVELPDAPKRSSRPEQRQQEPARQSAQSGENRQPKPQQSVDNRPRQPKPQQEAARSPKQETQRPPKQEQPVKREEKPAVQPQAVPVEEGSKGAVARDFLSAVIKEMGVENCAVSATQEDKTIILKLEGDATGVVIGKRGETLDALQYLSALASNRVEGEYTRVVIDSGNYRQRRQKTLEQLAAKLSASVLRSGKNVTLEPMNPYERRIIHAAVSEIEGVKSVSVGEEPNRSVVITTTDGVVPSTPSNNKRPPRHNRRPGGNKGGERCDRGGDKGEQKPRYNKPRNGNGGGNRPPREQSQGEQRSPEERPARAPRNDAPRNDKPASAPRQDSAARRAPTEAENQPMYGKIQI